jgi:hypothetical protein
LKQKTRDKNAHSLDTYLFKKGAMPPQRIRCETPPALWLNIKFNFGPVVKAGACASRARKENKKCLFAA